MAMARTLMASCLGVAHGVIAVDIWGYLASGHNPVANWLLEKLGSRDVFWVAIGFHDAIVNILIAVPFAALLFVRPSINKWKYAAVAGAAYFLLAFWRTFARYGMSAVPLLYSSPYYALGNAAPLLSLPIAFAAMRAIRRPSPQG